MNVSILKISPLQDNRAMKTCNNAMDMLYKSYDSLMISNNTAGSVFHSDQYFFYLSDTKRYFLKLWDMAGIL